MIVSYAVSCPLYLIAPQTAREEMEKLTGVNLSRPVSVGSVHSIIMREKRMRVGTCRE